MAHTWTCDCGSDNGLCSGIILLSFRRQFSSQHARCACICDTDVSMRNRIHPYSRSADDEGAFTGNSTRAAHGRTRGKCGIDAPGRKSIGKEDSCNISVLHHRRSNDIRPGDRLSSSARMVYSTDITDDGMLHRFCTMVQYMLQRNPYSSAHECNDTEIPAQGDG